MINHEMSLRANFEALSEEAKDLYLPTNVFRVEEIPEALDFLRRFVTPNIPVLIKGGAKQWPALQKWDKNYLTDVLEDKKVTVAVTPNGYADAITLANVDGLTQECFALPEERTMSISDLFSKLDGASVYKDESVRKSKGIFYLQKQNSNLLEEFPELKQDIDMDLPWARDAFGDDPTAVNLWIGDERSVTSLHKDPFENIYCVVRGWKQFTLHPPTDRPWLPYKTLPVVEYVETEPGNFECRPKENIEGDNTPTTVPWIAIDPLNPDLETYPDYAKSHPIQVTVEEGDLFYLPSLWFHHVRQSNGCIAVNFWYDMAMDIKYAYFQFLENLVKSCEHR